MCQALLMNKTDKDTLPLGNLNSSGRKQTVSSRRYNEVNEQYVKKQWAMKNKSCTGKGIGNAGGGVGCM